MARGCSCLPGGAAGEDGAHGPAGEGSAPKRRVSRFRSRIGGIDSPRGAEIEQGDICAGSRGQGGWRPAEEAGRARGPSPNPCSEGQGARRHERAMGDAHGCLQAENAERGGEEALGLAFGGVGRVVRRQEIQDTVQETLPQRITPELCRMLERYHPVYLNTQFNHPREITPEAEAACARLAGAGIPLGNQSVLLRGVNDSVEVMKKLCQELMRIRVRPYYIYQCQVLSGTRHFRTPIERGLEIMRNLQGYTSGLAVPKYVLDTPYGKIPIAPNYVIGREGEDMALRSWNGKVWREPNPLPEVVPAESDCPQPSPAAAACCDPCDCCRANG